MTGIKCEVCDKIFSSKSTFVRHFKQKHSSATFHYCSACTYKTVRSDTLYRHFRKKHTKVVDDETIDATPDANIIATGDIPEPMLINYAAQIYDITDPQQLAGILTTPTGEVPDTTGNLNDATFSAQIPVVSGIINPGSVAPSILPATTATEVPPANVNTTTTTSSMNTPSASPVGQNDIDDISSDEGDGFLPNNNLTIKDYGNINPPPPPISTDYSDFTPQEVTLPPCDNNLTDQNGIIGLPSTTENADITLLASTPPTNLTKDLLVPRTTSSVSQPGAGHQTSVAPMRVALYDLQYQPGPGEVFQVNNNRQLIKLEVKAGDMFQADWFGFLQPIILPIPIQLPPLNINVSSQK